MMNESAGKAASCLAISEKRQAPTRPGGCVGIFFQLFDWHRRFAKKKLFSRKLLPPARAKLVSRNLKRDDKMPVTKLHLIADENKGGFPNSRRNGNKDLDLEQMQKHEAAAPGLVARLMGLESMPAAQKKVTGPLSCDARYGKVEKFLLGSKGSAREDNLNNVKGQVKHELRPQKLQKTGPLERRAVTRFGAEALQIKGVLTKSRKHHHPKLLSPVKSPRISSIRNNASRTSRLIDAAAKILEPGLQARNRVKYALPYSTSAYPSSEVGIAERSPSDSQNVFICTIRSEAGVTGQASCIDCDDFVDISLRQNTSRQMLDHSTINFNPFHSSYQDSGINKPRPLPAAVMRDADLTYRRRQRESVAPSSPTNHHFQAFNVPLKDAKLLPKECQEQRCIPSHKCNPHQEESPSNALKNSPTTRKEMLETDKTPPTAKYSNPNSKKASSSGNSATGAKDFVALNRSLSGRTRPRVPVKAENAGSDATRKTRVRRADSLAQFRSPIRKIRSANVDEPVDGPSFVSAEGRKNDAEHNAVPRTKVNFRTSSSDRSYERNKLVGEADKIKVSGTTNNSVVSFTFNSPLKHKSGFPEGIDHKRSEKSLPGGKVSDFREPFDKSDYKAAFQKQFPCNGDALGALLDCKLKELISQEDDELSMVCAMPKRSTAMILQELIAALTAPPPLLQDCDTLDAGNASKKKAKMEGKLIGFLSDVNHFSPGSVLDASFSNDSCVSSSLDDSSTGLKLHPDIIDHPDSLQLLNLEADLLDSATSLENGRSHRNVLIDQITRLIGGLDLVVLGLAGSSLKHAKDVMLHAELLLMDLTRCHSDGTKDFIITLFLLDELERAAATTWTDIKSFFGSEEASKEGNQLRQFLFDCLLECLDSKYRRYCNFGYQGWTRQSLFLNVDKLIRDVEGEVRKWACLTGMTSDEIIDYEMSQALGKWTDFDIEAFENGTELGEDILSNLVEEFLIDL